jgi:hypothetical protein
MSPRKKALKKDEPLSPQIREGETHEEFLKRLKDKQLEIETLLALRQLPDAAQEHVIEIVICFHDLRQLKIKKTKLNEDSTQVAIRKSVEKQIALYEDKIQVLECRPPRGNDADRPLTKTEKSKLEIYRKKVKQLKQSLKPSATHYESCDEATTIKNRARSLLIKLSPEITKLNLNPDKIFRGCQNLIQ